jgi:hypothetical protein
MSTTIRTYSELMALDTIEERFRYLSLRGGVGDPTFGFDRYLNQQFYRSRQWKQIRDHVIVRDNGCDLAVDGFEIHRQLVIHHMNPMEVSDITSGSSSILDPEFLITTTHQTHMAIHYGNERQLPKVFVERRSGDTKLW